MFIDNNVDKKMWQLAERREGPGASFEKVKEAYHRARAAFVSQQYQQIQARKYARLQAKGEM